MKLKTIGKLISILAFGIVLSAVSLYGYAQYIGWKFKTTTSSARLVKSEFVDKLSFSRRGGWMLVKVRINNSDREYEFIFDTGAQVTVFSTELIKELQLDIEQFGGSKSDSEAVPAVLTMADNVQIGNILYEDVGAMAIDFEKMDNLGCIGADGIIGRNIIESALFQIDYRDNTILVVDDQSKLSGIDNALVVNYHPTENGTPLIATRIGQDFNANLILDTGFSGFLRVSSAALFSTIGKQSTENAYLKTVLPDKIFHKSSLQEEYKFKTKLGIGTAQFNDVLIDIENQTREKSTTNGLVGNDFLESFIVTTDLGNRRIYLEQIDGVGLRQIKSTFGFGYTPRDNKLIVQSLYHHSNAAKAGIRIGDEIKTVNNVDVSDISDEDACRIFLGELELVEKNTTEMQIEIQNTDNKKNYQLHRDFIFK